MTKTMQSSAFLASAMVLLIGVSALGVALRGGADEIAERPMMLYTHCGVLSTTVDDRLWLADPPLHDGSYNPLPGWDPNDTSGYGEISATDELNSVLIPGE